MDSNLLTPLTPVPPANPETEVFWEATASDKLLVKVCNNCSKPHFYPRAHCPFCFSIDTEWKESSGRGEIYSYTVMRRETPPRIVSYVRLDEGVIMLTNIIGCEPDDVRIGQRVTVAFPRDQEGPCVPAFVPAALSGEPTSVTTSQRTGNHAKD